MMHKSGYMPVNISRRKTSFLICILISICCAVMPFSAALAQGSLLISPKRIVFEGNKKTHELNLANTGTDTARYLISIKEIRMTEDGAFEEIMQPDPGQNFASKFLRFFPRSVTLAPNEAQSIKVQLIKTNELQPGEYRSHIYFRAIPNEKPLGENDVKAADTSISVQLIPVFGITIPAIIRVGESTTKVTLSDLAFQMAGDTMPRVAMALNRTGNMSAYGDILVTFTGSDGKTVEVGSARGVAIYTPNTKRRFAFDLNRDSGVKFTKGKLHVMYTKQVEGKTPEGDDILAEAEITLP